MKNEILFSFLPLKNSNFTFEIYRRSADGIKAENEYKYNLPISNKQIDIRDDFFVSFIPGENSVKYVCNSYDNTYMTLKWLISQLLIKTKDTMSNADIIVRKRFIPRISYIVNHTKYGDQVIDLESYYLKSTREFGFTIDFRFAANEIGKQTIYEKKLSLSLAEDGSKNRNFYVDKYKYIDVFISQRIPYLLPIHHSIGMFDVALNLKPLPYTLLKEKKYIFGDGQIDNNQFTGIQNHCPLSQPLKKPFYLFIFQKNRINISRELVKALRGETYNTFTGMQKMFGVDFSNSNIASIQVDDFTKSSLDLIESQLENFISEQPNSQIVGIFAGIQRDFDTSESYSPYYIVKNMFLNRGLAIQAVTIEQAQKRDGLKWSISGIGLQLFVKLGGTPWKVVPQNDNCLIFGISNAHIKDAEGNIHKYYAYSVCFDSSGLYRRLDILSSNNSKNLYLYDLKNHVSQTLKDQISSGITKCAIHVPFKLSKDEMACLFECIDEYKKSHDDIEIVFVKINVENRFFGYANYNSKIPLSGSYIELSDREFLVWFEGLQQGKENLVTAQSVTNPVHIEFIGTTGLSSDKVKTYLQDIINLSGANWRGYNAKHTPVSIYYPELIAKFIGRFDQYGLEMKLGLDAINKAWFV